MRTFLFQYLVAALFRIAVHSNFMVLVCQQYKTISKTNLAILTLSIKIDNVGTTRESKDGGGATCVTLSVSAFPVGEQVHNGELLYGRVLPNGSNLSTGRRP